MPNYLDDYQRGELEEAHPEYVRDEVCPIPMWDADGCRQWWQAKRRREQKGEDVMDVRGAFPGQYVKASDLAGKSIVVVIERVEMEDISGDTKPVVHFRGKDRGLALNKTNANMIGEVLGTYETDRWRGQAIMLYPSKTDYQGKRVDCIRIDKAPAGAPTPVPPTPPPFTAGDEDVPF